MLYCLYFIIVQMKKAKKDATICRENTVTTVIGNGSDLRYEAAVESKPVLELETTKRAR